MSAHRDFGAAVSADACGRIWFQGWLLAALLTRKTINLAHQELIILPRSCVSAEWLLKI